MNTRGFCKELVEQITHAEWDALDRCDPSLTINNHNREALLEMRALYMAPGTAEAAKEPTHPELDVDLEAADEHTHPEPEVDTGATDEHTQTEPEVNVEAAENLARYLQEYLDEYMPDAPEGHKWIVLASLYLAFVARRPLHPIDRAGVVVEQLDGRTIYRCPLKVPGDNPICDACVCLEK